ncbi:putative USP16 [Fasciola gigantica]|uniref:Putative USP16 n=1 Tax=Fasciola gigantica TaxID=46835 RepID=A0A504YIE8_FASGI|nr:putative USP16 [Fasciola gigantica]
MTKSSLYYVLLSVLGGKSKQELKRERRKKPQKMRRKHERARLRSELELAHDNSSGLAGNDDPVDTPLKSDPSAYDANSGPPCVHRRDDTLSETEFDHNPAVTVRSASASAEDDTHELNGDLPKTGECTNVIDCDGDTDEGVLVDVVDTLDKLTADKTVVNTEMTENTSGPATNLYDSQSDCADFEDSDGTERRNAISQPLDGDFLTNNLIPSTDAHDTTTVPEFLVEQLRQLDLDESKAANTESLLNRASRLAQIPLQASTLIPCGATRPLGDIACDLYSCLSLFTAPEHLIGANRIVCPRCNKQADAESDQSKVSDADNTKSRDLPRLTEAIRRDLVLQPPALLTIHLKRFQQIGVHIQKSQKRVSFPILLDLSPFCSVLYVSSSRSVRYRLYGVVEHLGRMAGGHYVAYVAAHTKSNAEMESDSSAQKSGNNSSDTSEFVKRFIGQLDMAPKWPMTTHDLLQRWRRCDRVRLSESVEETKSMVDDMLNRSNRVINGNPTADNSSPAHSQPSPQTGVPGHKEEEAVVDTRTWFRCSDEHVDTVPLSAVLECQAYVLFYERIE